MRLAWAGVVASGVGLVLSALLWVFAVQSVGESDPPVCSGRFGQEVACSVLGLDMRYASILAFVLVVLSLVLAYVSIRLGQGPGRRRRIRSD